MDVGYWNKQYDPRRGKLNTTSKQSKFSEYCLAKWIKYFLIDREDNNSTVKLLDLGAGNGADARYFGSNGINVTAVEQSSNACDILRKFPNVWAVNCDFTKFNSKYKYDIIYSRFSLDLITENEEFDVFLNMKETLLVDDGIVCIEIKCDKDPKFGLGTPISDREFIYKRRYTRYANYQKFIETIRRFGFEVLYKEESNGFNIKDDKDPVTIRVVIGL